MAAPKVVLPRRMTREEMANRDHRIFTLFLAATPEREIARTVGLSGRRVNEIIRRELKNASRHRRLLTDEALAVYQERLETLIRVVWPKVAGQDLRAVRVAAGLLQQQAQLYNFEEERLGAIPPIGDTPEVTDEMNEEADDLARYRSRHRKAAGEENS